MCASKYEIDNKMLVQRIEMKGVYKWVKDKNNKIWRCSKCKKKQLADRCQNRMIEHKIKKFFDNLFIYGMKVIPNNINNSQNAF